MANQKSDEFFCNAEGIMYGRGDIWVTPTAAGLCHPGCQPARAQSGPRPEDCVRLQRTEAPHCRRYLRQRHPLPGLE
ncbi:MAG: hypothetical protein WDO73_06205 [Ignavibacteriota bacterium]